MSFADNQIFPQQNEHPDTSINGMSPHPHPNTLFHLVPLDSLSQEALEHPHNREFISPSADGGLGLEIGYHVPNTPRGQTITRLGQDTDLTLPQSLAQVTVAFEFNPNTHLVVLTVRAKDLSTVKVYTGRGSNQP